MSTNEENTDILKSSIKIGNFVSILSYKGKLPTIEEGVFIADGSRIIGDVKLGSKVSVWFNSVIRGDVNSIEIGESSNVQDGSVIHCTFEKFPTKIGKFVTIAHKAMIHGCVIGDHCMIGMNSAILDGAIIGERSIIAAGCVVKEGAVIPPGSLVAGVPGKIIKPVSEKQKQGFEAVARRYVSYAQGYDLNLVIKED